MASKEIINAVWQKGLVVHGYDPNEWRADKYGALIRYGDYGKQTEYGWNIDHIRPVAYGGSDHINNLQPLQWQNNAKKGDGWW